jgi:DNA-binding HxlR family transcriptional regulator
MRRVRETTTPFHRLEPCESHEMLDLIGSKWALLTMALLDGVPPTRKRFSDIKRGVADISQRMLTTTLRQLERDGLVSRHYFPTVPPRVEYELTPLGAGMISALEPLGLWMKTCWPEIRDARSAFDDKAGS